MADQPDLSRLPRGQRAWAALVGAVGALDDRLERHYLEVKSDVDLSVKADQAKVAKFILGADNRDPDRAASYFDGHAVMILGVGSGRVDGIETFEAKDLESAVQRYIGVDGPRWDFERVPTLDPSKDVICVLVEPPRDGQVATCHRDGAGLRDGAIYIRADGQTREARGDEIRELLARASSRGPKLDLRVDVVGSVSRAFCSDQPFIEYTDRHASRLRSVREKAIQAELQEKRRREGLPNWPLTSVVPIVAPASLSPFRRDEHRTAEEYESEIATWSAKARASKGATMDRILGALPRENSVVVRNLSSRFLEDAEVNIHLEGPVRAINVVSRTDDLRAKIPNPPRPWGPWEEIPYTGISAASLTRMPRVPVPDTVSFKNGGSVTLTLNVGDLRPRETFRSNGDEFRLIVDDGDEAAVTGRWTVTARGLHEVFEGEIEVPIVDLDNLEGGIRRLLKLDGSTET